MTSCTKVSFVRLYFSCLPAFPYTCCNPLLNTARTWSTFEFSSLSIITMIKHSLNALLYLPCHVSACLLLHTGHRLRICIDITAIVTSHDVCQWLHLHPFNDSVRLSQRAHEFALDFEKLLPGFNVSNRVLCMHFPLSEPFICSLDHVQ